MIDLQTLMAQDQSFRAYVRAEAKRIGHSSRLRDRLLSEICCHYELESDEFYTADQKARQIAGFNE